jgi:hypothetical protein
MIFVWLLDEEHRHRRKAQSPLIRRGAIHSCLCLKGKTNLLLAVVCPKLKIVIVVHQSCTEIEALKFAKIGEKILTYWSLTPRLENNDLISACRRMPPKGFHLFRICRGFI